MIRVIYDGNTGLTIQGHAGSAPRGEDLICAAVTGLALALETAAEQSELSPGKARFQGGDPKQYEVIAGGLRRLWEQYPYAVHFKCMHD